MLDPRDVIALITDEEGNGCGTGFAIYKDHTGIYILTCAHVPFRLGKKIKVNGVPAELIAPSYDTLKIHRSFTDLAVLRINSNSAKALNLRVLKLVDTDLYNLNLTTTAGYTQLAGDTQEARIIQGHLPEEVSWARVGQRCEKLTAWSFKPEDGDELKPGYSGAPIIAKDLDVVGVLSHSGDKEGRVIPIKVLRNVWEGMPSDLLHNQVNQSETTYPLPKPQSNRFIYGRPLFPDEFIGREQELWRILSIILSATPVLIYGDPRSGKTSTLNKLEDYLENQDSYLVLRIDPTLLSEFKEDNFWQAILAQIQNSVAKKYTADDLTFLLKRTQDIDCSFDKLKRTINDLCNYPESSCQISLLIDEFERLLAYPDFQSIRFHGRLRWLGEKKATSIVLTSQYNLATLLRLIQDIEGNIPGSPILKHLNEFQLASFKQERDVVKLLDSPNLTSVDHRFVRLVAGAQPFLLQLLSANLSTAPETVPKRYHWACRESFERISSYYSNLWTILNDNSRTALFIVALFEFGHQFSSHSFFASPLTDNQKLSGELDNLMERGFVRKVSANEEYFEWQQIPVLEEERWIVAGQSLVWWVREVALTQKEIRWIPQIVFEDSWPQSENFVEWCRRQGYSKLISKAAWDELIHTSRKVNEEVSAGLEDFVTLILEALE